MLLIPGFKVSCILLILKKKYPLLHTSTKVGATMTQNSIFPNVVAMRWPKILGIFRGLQKAFQQRPFIINKCPDFHFNAFALKRRGLPKRGRNESGGETSFSLSLWLDCPSQIYRLSDTEKNSEYFLIKVPTLGVGVTETEKVRTNPFRTTAPLLPAFAVFSPFNLAAHLSDDTICIPVSQVKIWSPFLF